MGHHQCALIDGTPCIAIVGGKPDAKVVAFDKMTGKEIWRALNPRLRTGLRAAGDHRGGRQFGS